MFARAREKVAKFFFLGKVCYKYVQLTAGSLQKLVAGVSSPCPFARWGIDIVRPFVKTRGNKQFLVVAVDYITKWVEAEPVSRITEKEIIHLIWKNLCCRFGFPRITISDNGRTSIQRGENPRVVWRNEDNTGLYSCGSSSSKWIGESNKSNHARWVKKQIRKRMNKLGR